MGKSSRFVLLSCLVCEFVKVSSQECSFIEQYRRNEFTLLFPNAPFELMGKYCHDEGGTIFTYDDVDSVSVWNSFLLENWKSLLESSDPLNLFVGDAQVISPEGVVSPLQEDTCPFKEPPTYYDGRIFTFDNSIGEPSTQNVSIICRQKTELPCTFRSEENTTVKDSLPKVTVQKITASPDLDLSVECFRECFSAYSKSGGECWFYEIHEGEVCVLYFTHDRYFPDMALLTSSTATTLYVKSCASTQELIIETLDWTPEPSSFELFCPSRSLDPMNCESSPNNGTNTTLESSMVSHVHVGTNVADSKSLAAEITDSSILQSSYSDSYGFPDVSTHSTDGVLISEYTESTVLMSSYSSIERIMVSSHFSETLPMFSSISNVRVSSAEPEPMASVINQTEIQMITRTSVTMISSSQTVEDTSCDCTCIVELIAIPDREELMSKILHDLQIDKTQTSRNKRRFESINKDSRLATLSVGYLGLAVVITIFGGIILMDIGTLFKEGRMMIHNLSGLFHDAERNKVFEHTTNNDMKPTERNALEMAHNVERYNAMVAEIFAERQLKSTTPRVKQPTNRDRFAPGSGLSRRNDFNVY